MGILAVIKFFAPLSIYCLALVGGLMALTGKVRWALLLSVLLMPLRNVIEKLSAFPLGSQLLDILLFCMIIGWFTSTSKEGLFKKSPLNAPTIVLIIYLLFSVLVGAFTLTGSLEFRVGDDRVRDWKNFCLMPVLFFITANNIRDKEWVWRIFAMMGFAMLLVGYYTASQISSFSALESRAKISGTFQFLGPNEVAAFFNQYTIILMGVYLFMKRSRNKLLLLGLILVNIYCILFLYSRGAYAGLAFGMLVLFLFKNQKMLIPFFLVLMFWQVVLPEKAIERIKGTKNEYGELDESSERRIKIWEQSFEYFESNPIIGIGFGVFRDLGLDLGDTHNIYVKILVEQGVVGLLIFLVVVFAFMREGFTLYQKGDDDLSKGLGLGLTACMFVMLVNNFFGDRWTYFELSSYLWVYAGLVSRLNALSTQGAATPNVSENKKIIPVAIDVPKRKPRKSYYK